MKRTTKRATYKQWMCKQRWVTSVLLVTALMSSMNTVSARRVEASTVDTSNITDMLGGDSGGFGGLSDLFSSTSSGGFAGGSLLDVLNGSGGAGSSLDSLMGQFGELGDVFSSGSLDFGSIINGVGGLFGGSGGSEGGSGITEYVQQIIQGISGVSQKITQSSEQLSQITSSFENFGSQVEQWGEDVFGKILESMGGGSAGSKDGKGANPELAALVKKAMGKLNLPDPTVIAENIGQVTESEEKSVLSGVSPTTRDEIAKAMLNAQSARLIASNVLSKEAQEKTAEQLKGIMQFSEQSKGLVQASQALSSQAQSAGTLGAAASQISAQAATAVGEMAGTAQSAVSTQDVLKAQANISALQSQQLTALSDQLGTHSAQNSAQSAQLGNISGQLGTTTEIGVYQVMQQEIANQNLAASNQSLADISETEQGQVQKQQIDETSSARETNSSWSKVHLR